MEPAMQIGRVAKDIGLSIDAIRFYEKEGLLKPAGRSQGGFRLFGPGDVQTLRFIRNAQQLGFSLQEIRELLVLQDRGEHACVHVRELLGQKLVTVREKLAELQKLENSLKASLRKCSRALAHADAGSETCCPVLEEIEQRNANHRR